MKRFVTVLVSCAVSMGTVSVSAQDYGEKVEEDYNTVLARHLPKADRWFYVRGAGKAPDVSFGDTLNTTDEWRRVAKWQVDMGDYEMARQAYGHFIESKVATVDDLWNYVLVLKGLGHHEDALPYMRRMRDKAPQDLRVKEYFRTVYNYNELKRQNPAYRIHDLDINTADNHSCAVYYVKDQVALLFAKNKRGKVTKNRVKQATAADNVDLYGVKGWQGDQWDKETLNGPFCFAKNGKFVAATCIDPHWRDSLGVIRPQIYFSTMKQKKWLAPEPFLWNDTTGNYSVSMPALNKQGTMMIFASDRPGGFGGSDLWMVMKQGKNSWSEPVNLGDKINTEADEMFPYIDQTSGKLYFSSNGHNGLGGLDIYEAVQTDSCLCSYVIKNLGAPMNSVADDYAIVWNKKHTHGYFTSNRAEGQGGEDIYKFLYVSTKDPTVPHDWQGEPKKGAMGVNNGAGAASATDGVVKKMVVVNAQSEDPIANADLAYEKDTVRTDESGTAWLTLPKEGEGTVEVSALGYQSRNVAFKKGGVTKSDTISLRVAHGQHMVLKNIYYDFDQSDILPESARELDRLVAFMEDNPDVRVELSSHTDSRGSDEYNLDLSQRRADAAVEYVVGQGIDSERISAKGFGETKPLNGCRNGVDCTEEQHRQNRRTEIFIPTIGSAVDVHQTAGKFSAPNAKKSSEKQPVKKQKETSKKVSETAKKSTAKTADRDEDIVHEDGSFQWHRKMTKEEEAILDHEYKERQKRMDEEADAAEKAFEHNKTSTESKDGYQVIRHSDGTIEKRYTLY